jgi:hypothetical protein
MSRTNRRVVISVREDSSNAVERKLNEHILQSRSGWGKVNLLFHPGNKDYDRDTMRRWARERAFRRDLAAELLELG